jgi:hypothetical protein
MRFVHAFDAIFELAHGSPGVSSEPRHVRDNAAMASFFFSLKTERTVQKSRRLRGKKQV